MCGKFESAGPSDQYVRLTRGASYLVMRNLGLNAVTVLGFAIIARLISTKEMGVWSVLFLVNVTCEEFALAIPQAVTKFVAENAASGMRSLAVGAFFQGSRIILAIFAPLAVSIYLGASFLATHLLGDGSYATLFRILAVDVFFYAGMLPTLKAALLGLKMFREISVVDLCVGGFFRQLLVIALIVLMKGFVGLVIGWVISDMTIVVIYFGLATRALSPPKFNFPVSKLFRFSLPLTFADIVNYAQASFDRIVLLVFVPLSTFGIYNASLAAFGALLGISSALSSMLYSAYSSIQEKTGTGSGMRGAVRLASRYSSFTLTPLAFGLLATAKPALTLFVGESYVDGYVPLIIFSGAFALTAAFESLKPALLALGKTDVYAPITAVSVSIGLVAAYVLLPVWGIVGASTARALAMILLAVLTVLVLGRKIALTVDFRSIARNLFAGVVMAAVILMVQIVAYNKFLLPLYVLIGAIVYLVILRLLKAVNAADLDILRGFLGVRLSFASSILGWILAPD